MAEAGISGLELLSGLISTSQGAHRVPRNCRSHEPEPAAWNPRLHVDIRNPSARMRSPQSSCRTVRTAATPELTFLLRRVFRR